MKNITKTLGTLLLSGIVISMAITGCQKKANDFRPDKPIPKIDGYNNSAEVAAGTLAAYFPFNGSANDSVANISGATTKTAFDSGVKGSGFKGATDGFIIYGSPGATIPALKQFTVSFWMNAQKAIKDAPARGIFSLNNNKDFWGNLDIYLDSYRSLDTMNFKVHINNDAVNWKGQFTNALVANAWDKWVYMTATYNDTTSVLNIYANGEPLQVSSAANSTMVGPTLHGDDPTTTTTKYGPLTFVNASAMVVGSFQFQTTPPQTTSATAQSWAQSFYGGLDNFRIYTKPLTAKEIKALYLLEKAGR
jgi:hypothetical protein